jgi:DNA-directed RNA polymerase beta' subunit
MKVNIVNNKKLVDVNSLKEISNPVYFNKGNTPTEDGLFSYEIFGRPGSYDRKTIFAYIDLKNKFLHPLVYKNLLRLNRKFDDCMAGRGNWILDPKGEIMDAPEGTAGSGTGLDFLYKNWDKMTYRMTDSTARKERVDFLKALKRDEAFMGEQIVIPPYYRDINYQDTDKGKVAHDVINDLYAKLIRMTMSLKETDTALTGLDFVGNMTKTNIQQCLIDIYNYFVQKIKGKNGIFRQAVMGKSVDYAGRSVISAPSFNMNDYRDMKVSFEYSGVPLSQVIVIFLPFVTKWLQDFFEKEFRNLKTIEHKDKKTGDTRFVQLVNPMEDFTFDEIKKKIDQFVKAPTERFEVIKVNTEEGYKSLVFRGMNRDPNREEADQTPDSTISRRKLTWTDMFYMAAVDVVKDKHVYITRYPLEDYFGIYPSKVTVLSTFKTAPQYVNGVFYEHYPVINLETPKEKISGLFIDSLQLFNAMLPAIGGDFDGDQVTIRGVFTQEANLEAERLIRSPKNILNITGKNIRKISNEGVQTLYNLTKE